MIPDNEMRLLRKLGKPEIGLGIGLRMGEGQRAPFSKFPIFQAARLTGRAKLIFPGDSETMGRKSGGGTNGTDGSKELSYPAKTKDAFNSLGFPADDMNWIGDGNTDSPADYAAYNPAVDVGTWQKGSGVCLGGTLWSKTMAQGTGSHVTTAPRVIDTWELYYCRGSTPFGVLSYSVDGGSTTTNISESSSTFDFLKATIAAPTRTAGNTFRIARSTTNNSSVYVAGLAAFDSTAKFIDVMNAGARGYSIGVEFSQTDRAWRPQLSYSVYAAHLTGFNLGPNDFRKGGPGDTAGLTIANWKTIYQANINAARLTGDVFVMVPFQYGPAIEGNVTQAQMRTAIYELAATNNIPVYDIPERIGTFAQLDALGQMDTDLIHPLGQIPFTRLGTDLAQWIAA